MQALCTLLQAAAKSATLKVVVLCIALKGTGNLSSLIVGAGTFAGTFFYLC